MCCELLQHLFAVAALLLLNCCPPIAKIGPQCVVAGNGQVEAALAEQMCPLPATAGVGQSPNVVEDAWTTWQHVDDSPQLLVGIMVPDIVCVLQVGQVPKGV